MSERVSERVDIRRVTAHQFKSSDGSLHLRQRAQPPHYSTMTRIIHQPHSRAHLQNRGRLTGASSIGQMAARLGRGSLGGSSWEVRRLGLLAD